MPVAALVTGNRLAPARPSITGLALAASALVHAAAFVAFGPFASNGASAPAVPPGPLVVRVALAPWPAPETVPSPDRSPSPGAVRRPPDPAREAAREVVVSRQAIAPVHPEGLAMPPARAAEGDRAPVPASPPVVVAAAAGAPAPAAATALEPASYRDTPEPAYPESSRDEGEEGVVLLRVRISREGLPAEIVLDRSSGYAQLDRAAIAGVKRWSFTPARRGDEPVEAWMRVPIRFRLG